ncbi:uncharacterized protein SCODWIG_01733 [Saccharomycodes ludwigii]|uniref:Uncharacterized protein n=1 Tax=Saccharomycodes ludwigii TaxID=36035 RepID=A0A376B5R9_9ASCO|nr:uncharacterized protein SCODWIG_01733 [Saccharomycodes ludwigii]
MRVRYFIISTLLNELESSDIVKNVILENDPDFITSSLQTMITSNALCSPIGKCLATVLIKIYKENQSWWFELWVPQTIDLLSIESLNDSNILKNVQLYLLISIFKKNSTIFHTFVSKYVVPINNTQLLLLLLKIGQDLGIEQEPFHKSQLISLQNLEKLLLQDKYKLDAFELLTTSVKKSRLIQPYIYKILQKNIYVFFMDFNVASRNYFHSSFKRFLYRIRDSSCALHRTAVKLKKASNKFPEEQRFNMEQVENGKKFIEFCIQFIKFQLLPNSQYQRVFLAMKILMDLIESGVDNTVPVKYLASKQKSVDWPYSISLFDDTLVRLVCDNLVNNYDDVREISLKICLVILSTPKCNLIRMDLLLDKGLKMLHYYTSSETGAQLVKLVFLIHQKQQPKKNVSLINLLLNDLSMGLKLVDKSFDDILESPVNGTFTALALITPVLDFDEKNSHDDAPNPKEFVSQCLANIGYIWEIVLEILCHDSFQNDISDKYRDIQDNQLIVSFAFRSIKESSFLLENLIKYAPLTDEQLISVGDLLIEQLTTIRHSGAFQAVAPTFVACCDKTMAQIPEQVRAWVLSNVTSLESKSQAITRRSGGLPFLISAMLSSEKTDGRPLLKFTFEKLLEISQVPIVEHEDRLDLPQVNAFNCIKALFVESRLSDTCIDFSCPLLKLCLNNFNSPIWAMRNCSIMLFAALQNKLFGKLGRNTNARLFFSKYKSIREILLEKLENSINNIEITGCDGGNNSESVESLFLVLTIISRLKKTPGYTGLDDFKDLIVKCLSNNNWKIREMAARALCSVVVASDCEDLVKFLFLKELGEFPLASQNRLHGILLVVKEFLNNGYSIKPLLILKFTPTLFYINQCPTTCKIFIELITELSNFDNVNITLPFVSQWFVAHYNITDLNGSLQLLLKSVIEYLLKFETDRERLQDVLLLGLHSTSFEVQFSTLDYINNSSMGRETIERIKPRLLEIFENNQNWTYLRSRVLFSLQEIKIALNPEILFSILQNEDESDDLKCNALQSLGGFVKDWDKEYWALINIYSKDKVELPFRLACVHSLKNYYESNKSELCLFYITEFLFDDDEDIRSFASSILSEVLDVDSDIPIVLAKKFFEKNKDCMFLIARDIIEKYLKPLTFNISKATDNFNDELFAAEEDNIVRNVPELLNIMLYAKSNIINNAESKKLLDAKADQLTEQLSKTRIDDSILGWGSDPELFKNISILLILTYNSDKLRYIEIKKSLEKHNCGYIVDSLNLSKV